MKKPTILIVDDEKKFTDIFAEFLSERFNADVLVRKNAMEGIEVLYRQRVDVLFQDMIMPGPGGTQVINQIRNLKRINEMIVFIVSKWNSEIQTMKFENYGVKNTSKPVSLIGAQKALIDEFEACGGFDYRKKR